MFQSMIKFLSIVFGLLILAACASSPSNDRIAVLVELDRPKAVTNDQIQAGFNKSLPIYSNIPGLERKYFTYTDTSFGGLYLWTDKDAADAFYSKDWSDRIKTTYGQEANLTWFDAPVLTAGGSEGLAGQDGVVTIVKVSAPWYAPKGTIRSRMAEAVPLYSDLPGLDYKYFTIANGKKVGGVYLWENEAAAKAFYNTDWEANILETYGEAADLTYLKAPIKVINDQ